MRTDVIRLGRLSGERTGEMMHFLSSMRSDRCIAEADILVDIAHVLMLEKQAIIGADCARQLLSALLELYDDGIPEEVFDERYEDVHAGIESLLVDSLGPDIGGRMHMGRSRNDEVATCIRIRLREDLLKQMSALLKVREVLVAVAALHTGTVMPGFTHLQHAQPTTLAHHLLAYEQAFSRDFDRLHDAFLRVNLSPLGAAAFASSGYPVNREYTAALLGFDGLVVNTMDAVATRDFALETLAALSILMSDVSRLCEEVIIWSTAFVRFVTLDDAFCSTSSIMPQKKNPDTAEIMRAKAGSVLGEFSASVMIVKGLPMSYNRDLQELTPHLWRGTRDAKECLRLLIDMLSSATFDTGRMGEEAGKGFSTATDLADMLVRTFSLPFRTAHMITGRAVQKGDLSLLTLEDAAVEAAGVSLVGLGLTQNQIDDALDVQNSVAARRVPGGPSPFAVRIALDDCRKHLDRDAACIEEHLRKVSVAREDLIGRARRLVA